MGLSFRTFIYLSLIHIFSLETKWTEKEIGFQVELEEVKYTGNEGIFMHIWINLLDNAIKLSLIHI